MAKKTKKKEIVETKVRGEMAEESNEKESSGETLSGIEENGEEFEDYEIRYAAETLLRAEEVKQNKKLYSAAKDELSKKGEAIGKITSLEQLRAVAEKKIRES